MKFSAIRIRIGQVASRIVYMVAGNKNTKDEVFRVLAYGVSSILGPVEMDHAVQAGKRRAAALIPMRIKLLFREDIPTVLSKRRRSKLS